MSGNSLSRSEIDAKLRDLEKKLETLRRDYEQYFIGSRERPPRNTRRQVDRLVRDLEGASVTNTSQKFRLRSLVQRYTSYKTKWNRTQRQIEQGTYRPHQKKAERRQKERDEREKQQGGGPAGRDESDDAAPGDDGTIELDDSDFENLDLGDFEKELQEMDEQGAFDDYDKPSGGGGARSGQGNQGQQQQEFKPQPRQRSPESDGGPSRQQASGDQDRRRQERQQGQQRQQRQKQQDQSQDKSQRKKKKIRELQNKLGLSSGSDDGGGSSKSKQGSSRKDKLKSMRDKLGGGDESKGGSERKPSRSQPSRNDISRQRSGQQKSRDRKKKSKSQNKKKSSSQSRRIIDRSSNRRSSSKDGDRSSSSDDDDDSGTVRLYEHFIATRKAYDESVVGLSYEEVQMSMQRRRHRVAGEYDHPADCIGFQVVVKNEQVFLQPILYEYKTVEPGDDEWKDEWDDEGLDEPSVPEPEPTGA